MLFAVEPLAIMEKSAKENSIHPPRSRPTTRKERRDVEPPRSRPQRQSKTGRINEAKSAQKERVKPWANTQTVEQEAEMKVRSTVVDIDSVRDNEFKEENLGLLETAGQEDSKWNTREIMLVCSEAKISSCFMDGVVSHSLLNSK